ncbi:MAG: radical SAM protein [Candidatus Aminicenantia bacterium]
MKNLLQWNTGVRFSENKEEAIIVNLERKQFIKIKREALPFINKAINHGIEIVLNEISNKEREQFFKLISYLEKEKYLVEETFLKGKGLISERNMFFNHPKICYYEASEKCNLRCKFCYTNPKVKNSPYYGDLGISKRIIDKLIALNVINVIISGGEPFLRKDLFELISYAKDKIKYVTLTTNGVLLRNEEAKKLKELEVDSVQVSIESSDEKIHDCLRGKGTFKKAIYAVRCLKKYGFKEEQLYITATTTRINIKTLKGFKKFAEDLGVKAGFSFYQPVGRGSRNDEFALSQEDSYRFLFDLVADRYGDIYIDESLSFKNYKLSKKIIPPLKNHCGMVIKMIGVKEFGEVVPCHLFFSDKKMVIGNILEKDICKKLFKFYQSLPTVDEVEGCKNCNVRYFCGNGCWAHVYWQNGTFNHMSPYCNFFRNYYSTIVWNLGKENEAKEVYSILCDLAMDSQ